MPTATVARAITFEGSDAALVAAIEQGHPAAPAFLYDRYQMQVRRVLARVLGVDQDLPDLMQEVFARALSSIDKLEQSERLGAWLTSIAIFTARGHIRRRQRQRWLRFFAPEELPEARAVEPDDHVQQAMRSTYAVMERLPTDERIVFALRFIEGMELREIGVACEVSLATVKRRLARAEQRFAELARRDPVLCDWIEMEGAR